MQYKRGYKMSYEYKVVAFMGSIKGKGSADNVANQLTTLINSEAANGWELFQMGDVNIEVSPGCIAGLLGQKVTYIRYDQLVFRKPT